MCRRFLCPLPAIFLQNEKKKKNRCVIYEYAGELPGLWITIIKYHKNKEERFFQQFGFWIDFCKCILIRHSSDYHLSVEGPLQILVTLMNSWGGIWINGLVPKFFHEGYINSWNWMERGGIFHNTFKEYNSLWFLLSHQV